jgi:hypothetical protein
MGGAAEVARARLRVVHLSRGDLVYLVAVAVAYVAATIFATTAYHLVPDRMMVLAERVLQGRLDDPSFAGTVDSVVRGGRYYLAVGPLQFVPYLPFVPFEALHGVARYLTSLVPGLVAAWLALPLARAYGARGRTAYWVAGFTALGTLLFFVSVTGNMYYLAHAESFLALTWFLLEWAGRRRPLVLGVAIAISFLARPTTILAAIPFGIALVWRGRDRIRRATSFAVPVAAAIVAMGLYDAARFGSPFEGGYAISLLYERTLIARRALGVFSLAQVPENIRLAVLTFFGTKRSFPFLVPDPHGLSMLLVSPGLLVALEAGFRQPLQRTLWAATALVAIPVFLYYGGGYIQYGFRYSLDFTPFLVALVALGVRHRLGLLERVLFAASVASVTFGIVWLVTRS